MTKQYSKSDSPDFLLFKPAPVSSSQNVANCALVNAVLLCDCGLRYGLAELTNPTNVFFFEFSTSVSLAAVARSVGDPVALIFFQRSIHKILNAIVKMISVDMPSAERRYAKERLRYEPMNVATIGLAIARDTNHQSAVKICMLIKHNRIGPFPAQIHAVALPPVRSNSPQARSFVSIEIRNRLPNLCFVHGFSPKPGPRWSRLQGRSYPKMRNEGHGRSIRFSGELAIRPENTL